MYVRVSLTLDLDVGSPAEAAKMLQPMLAAMPAETGHFSWSLKGQEFFVPAERNGKRVAREKKSRVVRDTY